MSNTIIASGVPFSVSDERLEDFFSFCGRIKSVSMIDSNPQTNTRSYKVEFAHTSAVSTALLLNGAELDGHGIHVLEQGVSKQRDVNSIIDEVVSGNNMSLGQQQPPPQQQQQQPLIYSETFTGDGRSRSIDDSEDIPQEEKPKSTILAEYLSHGYVLSDTLIEKAILFDQARGISESFKSFLGKLDSKYHAHDNVQQLVSDEKVQNTLNSNRRRWNSYYDKFKSDKYGSKVHEFYTNVVNDAQQIHEEAKRLAALKIQDDSDAGSSSVVDEGASSDSKTDVPSSK